MHLSCIAEASSYGILQHVQLYMLGVDKMNRLLSYKWWRKVLFWLLEVTRVNSYILDKDQAVARGQQPIAHLASNS